MKTHHTRTLSVAIVALMAISMTGCTSRIISNAALRSVSTFFTGVVNDSVNAVINTG